MANTTADKLALLAANKTAIKAAINAKNPTTAPTDVMSQWPTAIASIQTGSQPVISPLTVTQNGTYTAPSGTDGYSPVTVNVQADNWSGIFTGDNPAVIDLSDYTGNFSYRQLFVKCNNPFTLYLGASKISAPLMLYSGYIMNGPCRMSQIVAPNLTEITDQAFRCHGATGEGDHGIQGVLSIPSLTTLTAKDWTYGCLGITEMYLPSLSTIPQWFAESNPMIRKITLGNVTSMNGNALNGTNTGSNTVDVYVQNSSTSLQALGTIPFGGTNYFVFHCAGDNKKIMYVDGAWTVVDE